MLNSRTQRRKEIPFGSRAWAAFASLRLCVFAFCFFIHYTQRAPVFAVEFGSAIGSPRALVALAPDQIRHLTPADVPTIRQVSATS